VESGEVSQSDDIKIAFDDSTAAVLLIALKEPESDLSVLKSILNKVAYNELVSMSVAQSRLCDP
jgi:flagellar hook-basal body complex protein FliE